MMNKSANPTYEELKEAAEKGLKVSYKYTVEKYLTLSVNGVQDMVFAENELGQAQIIARDGLLSDGISSVIIHQRKENE